MKLKRLWIALLCAACLIGGRKAMASEALVTMNGKPILTSEEVMKRFETGVKMALNMEMVDTGVALADLSINDLPISRTTVKEWVPGIVEREVIESIVQEWFKKNKDQERAILEKTDKDCKNSTASCEDWLAINKHRFFAEKHFGGKNIPQPQDLSKQQQAMMDTYKKEFGIKVHEDNVNKVVDRIISEWNIQKQDDDFATK